MGAAVANSKRSISITAVALALASSAPARSFAFSDPETFRSDVAEGGGGGRFFTGSPADGYTCNVCHSGAKAPEVQIYGLPLDGYTPSTSYEITIDWDDELENLALAFELNDGSARAAGKLRLPPQDELFEPERCVPVGAGIAAGNLMDEPNRTILEVPNCGAQRVRFLWTAPAEDRGAVSFSGSIVRADGNSDVAGDGVTNIAGILPSPTQSSEDVRGVTAGCGAAQSANANSGPPAAGTPWVAIVALGVWRRGVRRLR